MMRSPATSLAARLRELRRALTTLPDRRGWLESALWGLLFALVVAPVAMAGGLITLHPAGGAASLRTVLLPFLMPALLEEGLFRGLLLPHPATAGVTRVRRAGWWTGSLLAYVAAHPLAAGLWRPGARGVFDAPGFLIAAALLGVTATALYQRTGSLWPGVLLHGVVVTTWLNLGGAALLIPAG
jgi:uncharacterized protein